MIDRRPPSPARPQPDPLVCRDCASPVGADAARRNVARLAAAFPGISRRHAYCDRCTSLVEDLLHAVVVHAPPSGGGR